MAEDLLIDNEHGLLTITFNRADRRNAISEAMVAQMIEAFEMVRDRQDVRVVLLRGEGRDFSAGGDLGDMGAVLPDDPAERTRMFRDTVRDFAVPLFRAMHHLPQPVVVSCRGHVIGAAVEMAAVADLVIASETAKFCIPQLNLAHTVDHGESWHLPRKIGLARANQMCMLAERVPADVAERYGLVNWVVPDAELSSRTDAMIAQLLASPPIALRGMKWLLRQSENNSLDQQYDAEVEMLGKAVATDDFVEAMRAFREKRPPVFTGR